MKTTPIRWGILSTGAIARKFAIGLRDTPDAHLLAVGSRTQSGAEAFAAEFNIPRQYGSYEALAADPDVDVIYIGTPHPMHYETAMLCLQAGKPVLLEKPFALNAGQAEALIHFAREKRIFLMEAMWTRFTPVMAKVRDVLSAGTLGAVRMVQADFGFRAPFDPRHRLFAPELGGGALLDVGIYPVSFAAMVFGQQPSEIVSSAALGTTGVDEQSAMIFTYPDGALAQLSCAVRTQTPQEALIVGEKGWIRIPSRWWVPRVYTLQIDGEAEQVFEPPFVGNGYNYEAAAVGECLRAGRTESDIMPLDETLAIMRTLDAIRAQWDLVYPSESDDEHPNAD
jgi:predicted dehydrogenase